MPRKEITILIFEKQGEQLTKKATHYVIGPAQTLAADPNNTPEKQAEAHAKAMYGDDASFTIETAGDEIRCVVTVGDE